MVAELSTGSIVDLLDDDIADYTLADWRSRNIRFYDHLVDLGLLDPHVVPRQTHLALTDMLIRVRVGAATDPQNAGHVRAQNENVVHFALAAEVPKETLSISLEAGFIHDLNKAFCEPLRTDEYAVRDHKGRLVPSMVTMAQIVGLNHLGDRTRRALLTTTLLHEGGLDVEIANRIDRCIVHHGLGSSQFIQDLVDGKNAWWGEEFVDPLTDVRKLVHPAQPPLTIESVIHDLADSTQQMQGGAAWLMKYPSGFWRASGRSYFDMIGGAVEPDESGIAMSLAGQIAVETETCLGIIADAKRLNIVDNALAQKLEAAVHEATYMSQRWHDRSEAHLSDPEGMSVYHDVARALGVSVEEARDRLQGAIPGTPEGDVMEDVIWDSGRRLDRARARDLAHRISAV